jgi:hypothetical protein
MKLRIPKPVPEIAVPQGDASNLIDRLTDERAILYFGRSGRSWALRAEVLAQIQTGSRSLSAIAREYHVSKQAVSKIAKRARGIYGETTGG